MRSSTWRTLSIMATKTHQKARTAQYMGGPQRFPVPDDKVPWSVCWCEYKPVDYTAQVVLNKPVWADPDFRKETPACPPRFNEVDGKVDRTSFTGKYEVVDKVPRNPVGRTGMIGRGLLGRWGPNHAADPIVTRWKRDDAGKKVMVNGKPSLEFVAIKRKDTGDWAIPGGMVEPGDTVSATLKKEFGEEAMNSLEASEAEKKEIEEHINALFSKGEQIYAGYVDDPRNTDNSWMETVAQNFHDEEGDAVSRISLMAGDDAGAVKWLEANSKVQLYASHVEFVKEVVRRKNANWDD